MEAEHINHSFISWFLKTSLVVGAPTLLLALLVVGKCFYYTLSCWGWGANCNLAFGADRSATVIQAFMDENPGMDVTFRQRKE